MKRKVSHFFFFDNVNSTGRQSENAITTRGRYFRQIFEKPKFAINIKAIDMIFREILAATHITSIKT